MSYVDNKDKGTSTIKCDHKGCTKSFTGKNHGEAYKKAHAAGWSTPNAANAWCADHKAEHGARPAKKKEAKGGKKTAKAKKGKMKLSQGGRVLEYETNE